MVEFFQKIIDVFDQEKIPYMLSGSVAMSLYIVPRATRDFDFVIFLQPKNYIQKWVKKLRLKTFDLIGKTPQKK